jgi:hypothetical protein
VAQIENKPKTATQADSLFGSVQIIVSHDVMTPQGCAWPSMAINGHITVLIKELGWWLHCM